MSRRLVNPLKSAKRAWEIPGWEIPGWEIPGWEIP